MTRAALSVGYSCDHAQEFDSPARDLERFVLRLRPHIEQSLSIQLESAHAGISRRRPREVHVVLDRLCHVNVVADDLLAIDSWCAAISQMGCSIRLLAVSNCLAAMMHVLRLRLFYMRHSMATNLSMSTTTTRTNRLAQRLFRLCPS